MIVCTSISPTHTNKDIQEQCIKSWIDLGLEVYSFNCKAECLTLKEQYPYVNFIETYRTMEYTYGKPLVSINAVLDWCKDQEENNFCLINSDIEIKSDKETIDRVKEQMKTSIVLANRNDYDSDKNVLKPPYLLGIDIFFIHKKWMSFYPQSMHCFGMTFWDYYIPFVALRSGIEVQFVSQNIALHKAHAAQYSNDNWLKSGRYFLWEQGLYQFDDTRGVGQMSTYVYNFIYNASKRTQI